MSVPNPAQGEGRQQYLKRCMTAAMADGMDEGAAFSACSLVCRQHALKDESPSEQLSGSVELLDDAASPDAAGHPRARDGEVQPSSRRFAILGYTGQIINRWYGRLVIDLSGIRLDAHLPALRDHDTDKIVGVVDSHSIDAAGLQLRGTFSGVTEDAREVLALADEGFPWQASVGVWCEVLEEVEPGVVVEVNGQELVGPLDVWRRSYVREISFVPLGADANTAAVSLAAKESMMGKNITEAAPQGGAEDLHETVPQGVPAATPPADAPAPASTPVPQGAAEDLAAAVTAERQRVAGILKLCATHGIRTDEQMRMVDENLSLDAARARVLDLLSSRPGGAPVGVVEMGDDEGKRLRAAAADGLYMACGGVVEKPAPGAEQFRHMGLASFVRLSLRRAKVPGVDYMSNDQLGRKMLGDLNVRMAASTSDFANILGDVLHKKLREGAQAMPNTFAAWTARTSAVDFRDIYGVSLSDVQALPQVLENGEYPVLPMSDSGEKYRVSKYGGRFRLSLEMIVNDDLNAFAALPRKMATAWEVTKANIVYDLLKSSTVTMSDGKPLFDAAHGNLMTSGDRITTAAMAAARKLMRSQKDMMGTPLNIAPAFLLVGAEYENEALVLLKSTALPGDGNNSATFNQWYSSGIVPIVEPRLDLSSGTSPWYLAANPAMAACIEVAYLNNNEGVELFEMPEFETDGLCYKARGVMGCGLVDWRGMVKNPGKAAG